MRGLLFSLLLAWWTPSLRAQAHTGSVIAGVAYDSLHNRPLREALVFVEESKRSALTDEAGRFHIEVAGPGAYTLRIQHDALDSLGLSSARIKVIASDSFVVIGIPSFVTMWRRACGGEAPRDSALIFGAVTNVFGASMRGPSIVEVSWTDVSYSKDSGISQRERRGRVATDSLGRFAVCGAPRDQDVRMRALNATLSSGVVDVTPAEPVVRRDLRLGVAEAADARGAQVDFYVFSDAGPVAGARLTSADGHEARTDTEGHGRIRGVRSGTRQFEITAIGFTPQLALVNVVPDSTLLVSVRLEHVVALPGLVVKAKTIRDRVAQDFLDRRRMGLGAFRDSTDLSRRPTLASVFEEMPGLRVRGRGASIDSLFFQRGTNGCPANIILDGVQVDQGELRWLDASQLAAVEVYSSALTTPSEIAAKVRRRGMCGAVVFWTKRAFP